MNIETKNFTEQFFSFTTPSNIIILNENIKRKTIQKHK